jgi:hypothetical protein
VAVHTVKDFGLKLQVLRKDFNRNRRELDTTTQAIREALIVDPERPFEFAKERLYAVRDDKHKQFWTRIMAHLAQTIGYVAKEYDTSKINKKLEELEEKFAALNMT